MTHILVLGLALVLVYTFRDVYLDIQNRYDELKAKEQAAHSVTIIHANEKYCKENISQTKISA